MHGTAEEWGGDEKEMQRCSGEKKLENGTKLDGGRPAAP
jgi:hypothetical protein